MRYELEIKRHYLPDNSTKKRVLTVSCKNSDDVNKQIKDESLLFTQFHFPSQYQLIRIGGLFDTDFMGSIIECYEIRFRDVAKMWFMVDRFQSRIQRELSLVQAKTPRITFEVLPVPE